MANNKYANEKQDNRIGLSNQDQSLFEYLAYIFSKNLISHVVSIPLEILFLPFFNKKESTSPTSQDKRKPMGKQLENSFINTDTHAHTHTHK